MPEEIFKSGEGESWESQKVRDWLRKKFPPEQIGKIPASRGRPALDFVGHAAVTDRLNHVAPDWSYTIDDEVKDADTYWIRMTMTIGMVSRTDYGDGKDPKEAIGNAIRRCAMRYGVGLDLWSREELSEAIGEGGTDNRGELTEKSSPEPAPEGVVTSLSVPSGVTTYPLNQDDCNHRMANGHWVKWKTITEDNGITELVCPKCGLPQLLAMEG